MQKSKIFQVPGKLPFALFKYLGSMLLILSIQSAFAQKPKADTVTRLKNREDSVQYALGAFLGLWVINNGFTVINPTTFLAGMDEMFRDKPNRPINDSSILPIIREYRKKNQLTIAKNQEESLFDFLKEKPGIGKLPSGVKYTVLKEGRGVRPADNDSIIIHFRGALADKTVFEDTYVKNIPLLTKPNLLIPGLQEAITMMSQGAIWEIYIPASLAYGEKGTDNIPPNSALIIVIQLMEVLGKKGS